jgi:uncharacterized repeat protein (TIGR03803 family)
MRHSFLLLLPEVPMTRPFVRKALIRSAVVIFVVVLILLTPRLAAAEAQNRLTILYNFTNGSDGGHPGSGGLLYLKGSLYGTAIYAGNGYDDGMVFQLSNPHNTGWINTPIFTFCGSGPSCNPYGAAGPVGGLATDGLGNLYGTTELGSGLSSGFGSGTLFELTPSNGGWTPNWLFTPCCTPLASVTFDFQGNFYGTLADGYCGQTLGTFGSVYEWSPAQGGFITLHDFCGLNGTGPGSPVTLHGGNIYGSTPASASGQGIVFELQHKYPKQGWTEAIPYAFCALENCSDGATPMGGLIFDSAGNMYGTTMYGGANGLGTVFKLTPSSRGWSETVLYNFCAQANCDDGSYPEAGLVRDQAGNLYGTTCNSAFTVANLGPGPYFNMSGTVFQLTPDGVFNVFANLPGCSLAPLIVRNGMLYGTISTGGLDGYGAVFAVESRFLTTITLVSNLNPSTHDQAVTFTVTVTSSGPDMPTGKVAFKNGTTLIGTATLSAGVATLTTSSLAVGTHTITAQYQGDSASAPSTSSVLNQVVNPASASAEW